MLKLNPKFIGAQIFIRDLGRKIEVTERNVPILMSNGMTHLFVFDEPKKEIEPTTPKPTKKPRKRVKKDDKE